MQGKLWALHVEVYDEGGDLVFQADGNKADLTLRDASDSVLYSLNRKGRTARLVSWRITDPGNPEAVGTVRWGRTWKPRFDIRLPSGATLTADGWRTSRLDIHSGTDLVCHVERSSWRSWCTVDTAPGADPASAITAALCIHLLIRRAAAS